MSTLPAIYFDGKTTLPRPVTLSLSEGKWLLEGEDIHLLIPADETILTPALEDSSRFLRLKSGGHCVAEHSPELDSLARTGGMPRQQAEAFFQRLGRRPARLAILTLLLLAGGVAGFFWALPRITARIAAELPASLERRLGQNTIDVLDSYDFFGYSHIPVGRRNELIEEFHVICRNIGYQRPARLKFRSLYKNAANAFALPDGTIVVSDGLVQLATDNDEVHAVILHEIGHLEKHHSVRMLLQESTTLILVTAITGDASVVNKLSGKLPHLLTTKKFSREFETEADAFALSAMRQVGIPPEKFVSIMEKIEAEAKKLNEPDLPAYLRTHPKTDERLKRFRPPG